MIENKTYSTPQGYNLLKGNPDVSHFMITFSTPLAPHEFEVSLYNQMEK